MVEDHIKHWANPPLGKRRRKRLHGLGIHNRVPFGWHVASKIYTSLQRRHPYMAEARICKLICTLAEVCESAGTIKQIIPSKGLWPLHGTCNHSPNGL